MNGRFSSASFRLRKHGVDGAPECHRESLADWLADTRRKFAAATEPLSEPVLVRWKELVAELKAKNRTMTCEDSLIAATGLFHGCSVATRNRKHFEPSGVETVVPLA
jgi:toxin FitB